MGGGGKGKAEADAEAVTGTSKRARRGGRRGKSGGGGGGDKDLDEIESRATELNDGVFAEKPLDNDAVNAVMGMGLAKAMELFQELEEKADEIRNPSGFIKSRAKKEGFGPQGRGGGGGDGRAAGGGKPQGKGGGGDGRAVGGGKPQGKGGGGDGSAAGGKSTGKGNTIHAGANESVNPKVQKRAEWLNDRLFADKPISQQAIKVMSTLDKAHAMSLFQELQDMGSEVRNPSNFLISKAKHASSSLAVIAVAPPRDKGDKGKSKGKGDKGKSSSKGDKGSGKGGKGAVSDEDRIEKRAQWLNKSYFADRPLDDDSVCALMGMGLATAMDLFLELEEKGDSMRNPSAYVKKAAKAMGLAPTQEAEAPPPRPKGGGKGKNSAPQARDRGTPGTAIGSDPKKRPAPGDGPPGKRARRGR